MLYRVPRAWRGAAAVPPATAPRVAGVSLQRFPHVSSACR